MNLIKIIKEWFKRKILTEEQKINIKRKKTFEEKLLNATEEQRQAYYRYQAEKQNLTITHTRERLANKKYEDDDKRRIRFELVPKNQSNRNVRSYLEYKTGNFKTWQYIRNSCETQADGVCSICFKSSTEYGFKHNTECHEVWYYDYDKKLQILKRLEALCVVCHNIKHINQHKKDTEYFNLLVGLYADMNNIELKQAHKEYEDSLNTKVLRDNFKYKLELSYLKEYDIKENIFDPFTLEFDNFINKWNNEDKNSKEY